MATDRELPPCGLYRTTRPLPDRAEAVPAGRLVHFHNHSRADRPIVLLPRHNEHNVWTFHDKGFLVNDPSWPHSLEPLPAEGLYTASTALQIGDRLLRAGQLVQLGYNGLGEPILFFPTKAASANALLIPDKGVKVDRAILAELGRVVVGGPGKVGDHVH